MRISDWSSDVCSSDLQFRLGFTKAHGARSRTLLHLPQHEEGDPKDQKERQRLIKQNHPETGLLFGLATIFDIIVIKQIRKARIADRNRAECFIIGECATDAIRRDGDFLDAAFLHFLDQKSTRLNSSP